jgi:hypothetical protein
LRDVSFSASEFEDFPEERAAPRRRGRAPVAERDAGPPRTPQKKPSVLARVFAPGRMGILLLLGIGGLAFIGVPMNALFLQDGHHPAPLFTARTVTPQKMAREEAPPARRAQPEAARAEADAVTSESVRAEPEAPARAPKIAKVDAAALKAVIVKSEPASAARSEKKREPAARDPIAAMIGREAGAKPAPTESVVSAQRALQRLGYVVKPDGVMGAGTRQAIEKFERDNGLPVKGALSAKLARLLATRAASH